MASVRTAGGSCGQEGLHRLSLPFFRWEAWLATSHALGILCRVLRLICHDVAADLRSSAPGIAGPSAFANVLSLLQDLQWLPASFWLQFKGLLFTYLKSCMAQNLDIFEATCCGKNLDVKEVLLEEIRSSERMRLLGIHCACLLSDAFPLSGIPLLGY